MSCQRSSLVLSYFSHLLSSPFGGCFHFRYLAVGALSCRPAGAPMLCDTLSDTQTCVI